MMLLPPVLLSIKSRSGISKYIPMVWAKFRSSIKQRNTSDMRTSEGSIACSFMSYNSVGRRVILSASESSEGRRAVSKILLRDWER